MQALVLAGGLGTRLRPLKLKVPKPMAEVASKPFLEHLLKALKDGGVRDIVLLVGYKKRAIEDYFGDGKKWGMNIRYSREGKLLGTGGALKNAEKFVSGRDFLLLNGDTSCEIDLAGFMAFHKGKKALLTIAVTEGGGEGGKVEVGKDSRVTSFGDKGSCTNAGIYACNRRIFNFIPRNKKVSLELDVIPPLLGERMFAYFLKKDFLDIGTPERYHLAKRLMH